MINEISRSLFNVVEESELYQPRRIGLIGCSHDFNSLYFTHRFWITPATAGCHILPKQH